MEHSCPALAGGVSTPFQWHRHWRGRTSQESGDRAGGMSSGVEIGPRSSGLSLWEEGRFRAPAELYSVWSEGAPGLGWGPCVCAPHVWGSRATVSSVVTAASGTLPGTIRAPEDRGHPGLGWLSCGVLAIPLFLWSVLRQRTPALLTRWNSLQCSAKDAASLD